jgi:[NiFe] hydrogenase small subunit
MKPLLPRPTPDPNDLVSRRDFLKLCSSVAVLLGVGPGSSRVLAALATGSRPKVLWLSFSGCSGCSESVLRLASPFFDELIRTSVSLDYHELLMAPAGQSVEDALSAAATQNTGNFYCVVEGAIPMADSGAWGMIGGRTMLSIAQEICPKARAVICIGTCASYGGLPAAAPNPSQACGLTAALPGLSVPVVNMPGCPPNPVNFAAIFVSYLLNNGLPPALDTQGRPTFAYGHLVHDLCPYASTQRCQQSRGCKGPNTHNNCPQIKYNEGTSFPMQVGHPCIGCSEPDFWDTMSPFYDHYHVMAVADRRRGATGRRALSPAQEFDVSGRLVPGRGSRRMPGAEHTSGVRLVKRGSRISKALEL